MNRAGGAESPFHRPARPKTPRANAAISAYWGQTHAATPPLCRKTRPAPARDLKADRYRRCRRGAQIPPSGPPWRPGHSPSFRASPATPTGRTPRPGAVVAGTSRNGKGKKFSGGWNRPGSRRRPASPPHANASAPAASGAAHPGPPPLEGAPPPARHPRRENKRGNQSGRFEAPESSRREYPDGKAPGCALRH